jgi:hypothetical protein
MPLKAKSLAFRRERTPVRVLESLNETLIA